MLRAFGEFVRAQRRLAQSSQRNLAKMSGVSDPEAKTSLDMFEHTIGRFPDAVPAEPDEPRREVSESSSFSLHAGIAAKTSQRDMLEHQARFVARPPVATERLSPTVSGLVRLALKTPYSDSFAIRTFRGGVMETLRLRSHRDW